MYCKNCGSEIDEKAYICVKCGVLNGVGDKYCSHCGGEVEKDATVCMKCGYKIEKAKEEAPASQTPHTASAPTTSQTQPKSKVAAGLLGIFLGVIGVHNFYLGYIQKAVAQLILGTIGACFFGIGPIVSFIWGLIEGILILCGNIDKDAKGNLLGE